MRDEIAYIARVEFLKATTVAMTPAPIDDLLALLPVFRTWRARVEQVFRNALIGERIDAACTRATGTISPTDNSPEATALRDSIRACMERHRFRDSWLTEAAVATLFWHAAGRAYPRGWLVMKTWIDPVINIEPRRGKETDDEYQSRYEQEYRQQKIEIGKVLRFRTDALANTQVPAMWTARFFATPSYVEISRTENEDPVYIRKIVVRFAKRAGLTLPPVTLGITLGTSTGKRGKTRDNKGKSISA